MQIKYILILCFALLAANLLAHEQKVHEAITVYAAESALNNSPGFAEFLNIVSSDLPLSGANSGTNAMRIGSFNEDYAER